MKLKNITYSESRETVDARGLKQWKKIGIEVEVEEGEQSVQDWDGIQEAAKELVQRWHKDATSSNYFTPEPETLPVINVNDR